jgi:hypothetical protein
VPESALSPFTAWESFYVIVGSSGAALTGLQFVVTVLGAEARAVRAPELNAFGTPTIVHFCVALVLSAVLSAPWSGLAGPGIVLGVCGGAGLAYSLVVLRRAYGTRYRPVPEDWVWHFMLPFAAYAVLLGAGIRLPRHAMQSLFATGTVSILLLLIGIHNSWDSVVYIATQRFPKPDEGAPGEDRT